MKERGNFNQIVLFIFFSSTFFFFLALATKLSISIYFLVDRGNFSFTVSDAIESAKVGIAAGLPTGIGSWILTKIDRKQN